MAFDFSEGRTRPLADAWRARFDDAYRRYSENPTAEARGEVMKVLRIFADLVIRDKVPPDSE